MELIIKPTELCNFSCTFCSSSNIAETKTKTLDLNLIFDFLKRFPNTNTIIVNGGDPLMLTPSYYFKILDYIDTNKLPTILSFTTNLWAFYKDPDKWTELFKRKNVGVSTSFNYGNTRRISKNVVYTEDVFWKISDLFLDKIGYRPDFISVITDENADTAIENVRLAKKMDVECKLNYAFASGRQGTQYPLAKIYEFYIQIIKEDLHKWEFNSKEIINKSTQKHTVCPRSRDCDEHIRCLQPDGDYFSCGAFGDDQEHPIDFHKEVYDNQFFRPLDSKEDLYSLKQDCLTCPLFSFCNGCRKTIDYIKKSNTVDSHCASMKMLESDILSLSEIVC